MFAAMAALLLQVTPVNAEPSFGHFIEVVEPAIRDRLIDPESARFEWPYGFTRTKGGRLVTCGFVNSKNRMGGYTGRTYVIVTYVEGEPPYFNIEDTLEYGDGVRGMCQQYLKRGQLTQR